MDFVLELLDWAQGKDIGEIYYENRSNAAPVIIHLTFGSAGPAAGSQKKLGTIHSPAIGKLSFSADKVKVGSVVKPKEILGFVEGDGERVEICASFGGKILEAPAANGASVNFSQPLLVVELS